VFSVLCSESRVRVQGLRFRYRVYGLEFRVKGLGFRF
jgi:hypothetical protein